MTGGPYSSGEHLDIDIDAARLDHLLSAASMPAGPAFPPAMEALIRSAIQARSGWRAT
jgi:hypothetical protein